MREILLLIFLLGLQSCQTDKERSNETDKDQATVNNKAVSIQPDTAKYCVYDYYADCGDWMIDNQRDTSFIGFGDLRVITNLHCAKQTSWTDTVAVSKLKNCDYHVYPYLQNQFDIDIIDDGRHSIVTITPMTFFGYFKANDLSEYSWLARKGYLGKNYTLSLDENGALRFVVSINSSQIDVGVNAYYKLDKFADISIDSIRLYESGPPI